MVSRDCEFFSRDGTILAMNDAQLLANCPDFISLGALLKASPVTEGGERICYLEASNEGLDQQAEVVAAKALADSAGYFLRYGNIDIDHYTMIGAKAGIPDYALYEIGQPLDVVQRGGTTFVKSRIYAGDGPAAERANYFWSSLTDINPPARWYPSVGGAVLEKAIEIDPASQVRKAIVKRVRWSNIGMSKTPVNQHVGTCATVPIGAFAKSMTATGGFDIAKALSAGYGTDSADLTGGGAMRKQSLHGSVHDYYEAKDMLARAIRKGVVSVKAPRAHELLGYLTRTLGVSADTAAEYVERFMRDLTKRRK